MRPLALILLLTTACAGGDEPADTDGPVEGECTQHPLIPEDKECLWAGTDDGCMSGEAPANQLRWMFEGRIEADGTVTGTERFWWFYPMEGFEDDCIDTFEVTGTPLPPSTDFTSLNCAGCEEFYELRREKTEDNCAMGYSILFDEDREGLRQILMLDTLTPNGEPQENGNVLVMNREPNRRGDGMTTKEYARGTYAPDGDEVAPPATITWEGQRCMGR